MRVQQVQPKNNSSAKGGLYVFLLQCTKITIFHNNPITEIKMNYLSNIQLGTSNIKLTGYLL
jgi:hypothetical protein